MEKSVLLSLVRGILPYFSTDTWLLFIAAGGEADAILMAKNGVDSVYNADQERQDSCEV